MDPVPIREVAKILFPLWNHMSWETGVPTEKFLQTTGVNAVRSMVEGCFSHKATGKKCLGILVRERGLLSLILGIGRVQNGEGRGIGRSTMTTMVRKGWRTEERKPERALTSNELVLRRKPLNLLEDLVAQNLENLIFVVMENI